MAQVTWDFSTDEISHVQDIVATEQDNPFVQKRKEHNVKPAQVEINEDQVWESLLAALLTSQQRSGPDSHVSTFLKHELHRISLSECRNRDNVSEFVATALEDHGGIRYYNNIGEACETNLERLETGGWEELWTELEKLVELRARKPNDSDYVTERHVATYLSKEFAGERLHRVGPKQARNILQILGLTRYETPLDSRITKWLNTNFDLPYTVSGQGLNNPEYYHFIMDIIQDSCATADVLPCIFDAAVFSSYDTNWTQSDADAIF